MFLSKYYDDNIISEEKKYIERFRNKFIIHKNIYIPQGCHVAKYHSECPLCLKHIKKGSIVTKYNNLKTERMKLRNLNRYRFYGYQIIHPECNPKNTDSVLEQYESNEYLNTIIFKTMDIYEYIASKFLNSNKEFKIYEIIKDSELIWTWNNSLNIDCFVINTFEQLPSKIDIFQQYSDFILKTDIKYLDLKLSSFSNMILIKIKDKYHQVIIIDFNEIPKKKRRLYTSYTYNNVKNINFLSKYLKLYQEVCPIINNLK